VDGGYDGITLSVVGVSDGHGHDRGYNGGHARS